MSNEADTCREYVVPKLTAAGWRHERLTEQYAFTDGRIVVTGGKVKRRTRKRADYLLRYTRDFMLAVVEAKADYKTPGEGLQQAKDYAEILGLKFAYATNGEGIIEFDYLTGQERELDAYPTPDELWARLRAGQGLSDTVTADRLLTPFHLYEGKTPRYYQEIAINRATQSILQGQKRGLLTMATGTGKTLVAFQICWKLWNARWNRPNAYRRPKILYLADRNILVDDPKDKTFLPFGDARYKIENGTINQGRELYFAIYQALAGDERRDALYRQYAPDFFDLIIVDECHRGSSRDSSNWREILTYFQPAFQLGLTATPRRADNADTYEYFGEPLYTYSLRQGIEDGFLAPYRVHRVISSWDAAGWRPTQGEMDRYGREIPDEQYETKDFERIIALKARTHAHARHLTDFLKQTDRFAKTIVFCVDQEHAAEMRHALAALNADVMQQYPDYVCRVTNDEGDIGRAHLSHFQEVETVTPAILTTSQMLTTGVDAPTCKNVALARVINSMTEFKQIIGRGTRVREEYGKMFFNILDYTGTATRLFADPAFDGEAALITNVQITDEGETVPGSEVVETPAAPGEEGGEVSYEGQDGEWTDGRGAFGEKRGKYYVDAGHVEIAAHLVYEMDADGKQLRVIQLTDYAAERVRSLYASAAEVQTRWADPEQRAAIVGLLQDRGIDVDTLADAAQQPDADPLDLLCHLAFDAPLRTRRERAERLRRDKRDFFDLYGPQARVILSDLLDKYAEYGTDQFHIPATLRVPPISEYGSIADIADFFGGAANLRQAVLELQTLLYA